MIVSAELDSGADVGAEAEAAGGAATGTEDTRPPVRVLGIRHHGPGSARALVAALEAYRPDCVLIEGPADADGLIEWAGRGLEPPVALLAWDSTDPSEASCWPMAVFSPEWQALSWAVAHGAQARFMDLPAAAVLATRKAERERARSEGRDAEARGTAQPVRTDPIAELARLAGYEDPEAWWEDVVELRMEGEPFDALSCAGRGMPRRWPASRRRSRRTTPGSRAWRRRGRR